MPVQPFMPAVIALHREQDRACRGHELISHIYLIDVAKCHLRHKTCSPSRSDPRFSAVQVYVCLAAPMQSAEVIDTTGAGDAFIASVIYGVVKGKSFEDTLRLGTVVAASKCTKLGARPGLPQRSEISPELL